MPPKGRVIHHDDDDDDDDADLFHTAIRLDSKGMRRIPSTTPSVSRTTSYVPRSIHSSQSSSTTKTEPLPSTSAAVDVCVIDLDDEEESYPTSKGNSNSSSNNNHNSKAAGNKRDRDAAELDTTMDFVDIDGSAEDFSKDETYQKLLELRQKISRVNSISATSAAAAAAAVTSAKHTTAATVTTESTVLIPQVLTAAERQRRIEQEYAQRQQNKKPRTEASNNEGEEEDEDDDEAISLKTRLAGCNDERKFKLNPEKSLEIIKSKLAKLYGISANLLVFKFDGEKLDDKASPSDVGIEDDDLLDVQITDKTVLEKVVAALGPKR